MVSNVAHDLCISLDIWYF